MPESPTANMLLVKPSEGSDSGLWDAELNDALDLIDSHNHTTGQGVKVPTAGISINADLTFTTSGTAYAATDMKAAEFSPVAASAMTAYAGAFFVNSDDSNNLYFRTVAGSNVKVTSGATLNVGAFTGGFGGDYGSIPAEANFVDASKSFTFKSTVGGQWSRLQAGAMRISEFGTTETTYVELACPSGLVGTYTITMPTAAPGSTSIVSMSSTGVLSASNTIANAVSMSSTLGVTGLITASAGVTAAANQHVTVSGTGLYKHGTLARSYDGLWAKITSGTPTLGAIHQYTGVSTLRWPIDLDEGKRITAVFWDYNRASAGTVTLSLKRSDGSAFTTISTTSDTTGTVRGVASATSINHTMLADNKYFIEIQCSDAANIAYGVAVEYDQT